MAFEIFKMQVYRFLSCGNKEECIISTWQNLITFLGCGCRNKSRRRGGGDRICPRLSMRVHVHLSELPEETVQVLLCAELHSRGGWTPLHRWVAWNIVFLAHSLVCLLLNKVAIQSQNPDDKWTRKHLVYWESKHFSFNMYVYPECIIYSSN